MSDRFIQVLEGAPGVVGALYDRILADTRHRDVVVVLDGAIQARAFSDWSMRLLGEDDLSPTEQAIAVQALGSVDTGKGPPRRAWTTKDLLAGPVGVPLAGAFRGKPRDAKDLETIDRLLEAAETIMLRQGALDHQSLDEVAHAARIPQRTAHRYFKDLDDLLHFGVWRILAIEHQNFLNVMVSHPFESRSDVALAIVDFVTRTAQDRPGLTRTMNQQIRRDAHVFTCESAWSLADAICVATPRPGWPCTEVGPEALAVGLAATASSAWAFMERGAPRRDASPIEDRLLPICDAALGGG
jgi:AcrR family transcriptional regulator